MFALARMAGGTGLGFAWIRRFGAFVSGVGRGSGGGVFGRVFEGVGWRRAGMKPSEG